MNGIVPIPTVFVMIARLLSVNPQDLTFLVETNLEGLNCRLRLVCAPKTVTSLIDWFEGELIQLVFNHDGLVTDWRQADEAKALSNLTVLTFRGSPPEQRKRPRHLIFSAQSDGICHHFAVARKKGIRTPQVGEQVRPRISYEGIVEGFEVTAEASVGRQEPSRSPIPRPRQWRSLEG